jgi:cysteine desulfurase family protein
VPSEEIAIIYFDNAATSWPKPETVYQAVDTCLRQSGANPGRSAHRMGLDASRLVTEARSLAARLFNAPDPLRIIFTYNTTEALNLGLKGLLQPGDHVVTDSLAHNSVTRPLALLSGRGVEVTKLPASLADGVHPAQVEAAVQTNTRLIVLAHASNVSGTLNDIRAVGAIARSRGVLFLVDAAQTAGSFPLDVQAMHIDLLAFPGHKGLLGPQGVGGLYLREGLLLTPLKEGGTGSHSESPLQPEACPERYESGTLGTPAIAGLAAGLKFLMSEGIHRIREKERLLTDCLLRGLSEIPGVTVYGPPPGTERAALVSFNIQGLSPSITASILDQSFGIAARAGLHCSPEAHKALATLPEGAVRFSVGYFNTAAEVEQALNAVQSIAAEFSP